jgi:hypothetical protein
MSFVCRYCEKDFKRESTLGVHQCKLKRRWQQEKSTWVQLGLRAYLRFFELTQGSSKLKSYEDFVVSSYYTAFVKFGSYCQQIRCVDFGNYLDWLLKNNKKIDKWTSDKLYTEWLPEYLRQESTQSALERGLKEMQTYADDHPEFENGFSDYFRAGNSNRICQHICNGRISAWIVYNCDSGIEFLDKLNEEQVAMIIPLIDPAFWQKKFKDYVSDAEWVKHILKTAGL